MPPSSRTSRPLSAAALLGASALVLTGCGAAPEEGGQAQEQATDFTGCIVSDEGGFEDRSFNQSSYEGLQAAAESTGLEVRKAQSQARTDYGPNLKSMIQQGCDLTVAVGFALADDTKAAAEANPDAHFAIVDDNSIDLPNVKPLVYNTAEAAFLAGYVAAGTTETGKVATYGGQKFPTVTVFMDGFADGVAHYNEAKGKDVQLLGWDKQAQDGTFVNSFTDTSAAKTTTQNFINEGADVVLPVAGQAALGTLDAVNAANAGGKEVRFVWVDADGYETLDQGRQYQLTSVLKEMEQSVQDVVESAAGGEFSAEPYVGTLGNGGVGIAPYHDQEQAVGEELAAEVEQLKQDIVDGTVSVESESSPRA